YIEQVRQQVQDNLKCLTHAPSVQMQDVPPDFIDMDLKEAAEEPDPDSTKNQKELDDR
ncbi:putative histone deacetylase 3 isoform X1, partial [Apostichopus japonicus]